MSKLYIGIFDSPRGTKFGMAVASELPNIPSPPRDTCAHKSKIEPSYIATFPCTKLGSPLGVLPLSPCQYNTKNLPEQRVNKKGQRGYECSRPLHHSSSQYLAAKGLPCPQVALIASNSLAVSAHLMGVVAVAHLGT